MLHAAITMASAGSHFDQQPSFVANENQAENQHQYSSNFANDSEYATYQSGRSSNGSQQADGQQSVVRQSTLKKGGKKRSKSLTARKRHDSERSNPEEEQSSLSVSFAGMPPRRNASNQSLTRINNQLPRFGAYSANHQNSFEQSFTPQQRDRFRRRLKYFFMNPIDKWRAKGRLPWKLGLQVIKIIVVTLQLLIFGLNMSKYLLHQGNMVVSFREMFLTDWDPVREVMSYPPAAGPYAVYSKQDLYAHMNYAVTVYSSITTTAIGSFGYGPNITADNEMSAIR